MNNFDLSALLFLQFAVILAACRVVAALVRFVGQPPVVSEMIAGLVLGPSVFGALCPELQSRLFPKASMAIIYAIAHLGVALYMFLVGAGLRASLIRERGRSAASLSIAGIVAPFTLGAIIAVCIRGDGRMFGANVSGAQAALYMGAAMSITAFPMLARIIQERGLGGTALGTLALAAGAVNDAAAWCILAVVLASLESDPRFAVIAIMGVVAFTAVCLLLVRPALRPLGRMVERAGSMSGWVLAFALVLMMIGAWLTDVIGIYEVFGAFVMGAVMPRGRFAQELQRLIGPLTTTLLVPLFFVYSGLNTRIDLVNTWGLWGLTGLILVAACAGKGLACFGAARLSGEPVRQAAAIGALMNARGMMELIILNIGYDQGLITQTLYSIMVVMAVVTTLMATPACELALGRRRIAEPGEPTTRA